MNKKAFTLIELLATIIILGVIGLIVYPTLNKVISGNKDKAFQKQVEEVERIASHWSANNDMLLPYENDKSYYLYLEELYSKGLIDKETVFNPKTNEEMKGCVVITWKSDINQHTYTYDEECIPTEPPVIAMNVDSNIINSKGWAKENLYVKIKGEYLTSYNYCVSELDCTPNTNVTGTSGSIYITKEGTNKVCVEGINKIGTTGVKCEEYKLDKTAPVIGNIVVNGTLGLNNWYISNVVVSKTESSDTLSGIESNELSPSITNITTDTTGTVYTLTAKDNAGNISTRSYSFKVDKTAPTVGTANIAGTLGSNNWYTSNVTITPVNGSDTTSGHSSTTSNISSITSNTTGQIITITTTDIAGNSSTKTYTVKVDKNSPTLTAEDGLVEIMQGDSNLVSNYFNQPTYSISGGNLSCSPVNTSGLTLGQQTVTCTATGNNGLTEIASKSITVNKKVYVDGSGANYPDLLKNMIPIRYDGKKWVYADIESEPWYNYKNKEWANAVILNSGVTKRVGDTISETDIALWYVWIPRYKYKLFNADNGSTKEQEIEIVFETKEKSPSCGGNTCTTNRIYSTGTKGTYLTHPAFTFGDDELDGFWVGKFEVSFSKGINTLPNVESLTETYLLKFNTFIKDIEKDYEISNGDSHIVRNMEWGAVAYLKQSKYGLGTTDIGINNNYSFTTGCGAPAGSSKKPICRAYNTKEGMLASTTGNIYGVYDMSGGAQEYVMGNMVDTNGAFQSSSSDFRTAPDPKYYDSYAYGTSNTDHARGLLGDGTKEILKNFGGGFDAGWYGDNSYFVNSNDAWFVRGDALAGGDSAGVFAFSGDNGGADKFISTRVVLVSK